MDRHRKFVKKQQQDIDNIVRQFKKSVYITSKALRIVYLIVLYSLQLIALIGVLLGGLVAFLCLVGMRRTRGAVKRLKLYQARRQTRLRDS